MQAEVTGDIQTCLHDATVIYSDAKTAITDFEEKSLSGMIAGVKEVIAAASEVKQATTDCSGILADWYKLETLAEIASNPVTLEYEVDKHLIFNGVDIYKHIDDATVQYKAGNLEAMGEDLGNALAKLVVGGALEVQ